MPACVDPTNAIRQRRHRLRKKALAAALAAPTDKTGDPSERDEVRGAIAHLQRLERRHAAEAVRHTFAAEIEASADLIARKLIEMAVAGDPTALALAVRSVLPIARTEDRRINLDLPALTSLASLAEARRRVGEAVGGGRLGLEDAERLMRVLDAIETTLLAAEKRALLGQMRRALDGTGANGPAGRVAELAARAELVMRLGPPQQQVDGAEADGMVDDTPEAWTVSAPRPAPG